MVVGNFDLECVAVFPDKANPELIIDPYAELTISFGLQNFQAVPGRNAKIVQSPRRVQEKKLSQGCANQARRKLPRLPGRPQ
jgi:hypothetical protein